MAQQVAMPAAQTDNLSSVPESHVVERENQLPQGPQPPQQTL